MAHLRTLLAVFTCISSIAFAAETNVSACLGSRSTAEAVSLEKNEVLVVTLPNGAAAAVQLTTLSLEEASYRWRFREAPGADVKIGAGRVFEDFSKINLPGANTVVLPRNGTRNLYVIAGGIMLMWSGKDRKSGWVYYCRDLAKVETVPLSEFSSKP
ncbi:MAG: hypothetical protein WC340_14805 [Kiritimatiellia bacterium]